MNAENKDHMVVRAEEAMKKLEKNPEAPKPGDVVEVMGRDGQKHKATVFMEGTAIYKNEAGEPIVVETDAEAEAKAPEATAEVKETSPEVPSVSETMERLKNETSSMTAKIKQASSKFMKGFRNFFGVAEQKPLDEAWFEAGDVASDKASVEVAEDEAKALPEVNQNEGGQDMAPRYTADYVKDAFKEVGVGIAKSLELDTVGDELKFDVSYFKKATSWLSEKFGSTDWSKAERSLEKPAIDMPVLGVEDFQPITEQAEQLEQLSEDSKSNYETLKIDIKAAEKTAEKAISARRLNKLATELGDLKKQQKQQKQLREGTQMGTKTIKEVIKEETALARTIASIEAEMDTISLFDASISDLEKIPA